MSTQTAPLESAIKPDRIMSSYAATQMVLNKATQRALSEPLKPLDRAHRLTVTLEAEIDFHTLVESLRPEQVLNLQHAICASSKLPMTTVREVVNAASYND